MLKDISLLLLLFILECNCNNKRPVVTTSLGKISGYFKTSYNGRKFSAFEGIPYAKPPIGDKRFEEPEPVEPWLGTWNATISTFCAQISTFQSSGSSGDEDCLHINVYVPGDKIDPEKKLEVVVHIHGGAFMYGSGHYYSTPERPMDRDIIFVTFNYRLGILGFLSTEDDVVPGNNGLKDQTLALKWIKNNIASFGGNPDSITLTGMSAGGSSVHMHYFSESSKGLFHRGLSQSGFALNPWSIGKDPLSKAKQLGDMLGCPTECTRILIDCLKQRPQSHILDKTRNFFAYGSLPIAPFGPVIEKAGTRPFLTEHPYVLLRKGKVLDVPWIKSVTANEGMIFAWFVENIDYVGDNWDELAPALLEFDRTLPQSAWKNTSQNIRERYFGKEKINKENLSKFAKLFGNRHFFNDADEALLLQSKNNKSPVYFFIFGYLGDKNEHKTVSHGAEIKYLFRNVQFEPNSPDVPLTPNEVQMKDAFWDLIVSYAKIGKPTIAGVQLEPTKSDKLTYFKINGFTPEDIVESTGELTDKKFWKDLGFNENANLGIEIKDEL